MKNKPILILFVIFHFYVRLSAQDYQSVRSDFKHYFRAANGVFKGMKTDSVKMTGSDSVIYNFRTYRENLSSGCAVMPFAPSWLGDKVIVRTDGTNLLFNKHKDTITINTKAAINDSWTVLHLMGGQKITGKIISITQETILGQTDSVKTIRLEKQDQSGMPLADTINGKEICLGKRLGLTKTLDFFAFPSDTAQLNLLGMENPVVGYTVPTWGQIYDFEIGDEFHYEYTTVDNGSPYWSNNCHGAVSFKNSKTIETITAKTQGQDSVTYTFHIQEIYHYNYFTHNYYPPDYNYDTIIIRQYDSTRTYYDLNSKADSLYPEEFRAEQNQWYGRGRPGTMLQNDSIYLNRMRIKFYYSDEGIYTFDSIDNNGCSHHSYHLSPNCGDTWHQYTSGCGKTFAHNRCQDMCWDYKTQLKLVYYKKGTEQWGVPWSQSVMLSTKNQQKDFDCSVSPNPNSGNFSIKLNLTGKTIVKVVNIFGQMVFNRETNLSEINTKIPVNIEKEGKGIYFVQIKSEHGTFTKKVVVE